jgi:hypothetical protein
MLENHDVLTYLQQRMDRRVKRICSILDHTNDRDVIADELSELNNLCYRYTIWYLKSLRQRVNSKHGEDK